MSGFGNVQGIIESPLLGKDIGCHELETDYSDGSELRIDRGNSDSMNSADVVQGFESAAKKQKLNFNRHETTDSAGVSSSYTKLVVTAEEPPDEEDDEDDSSFVLNQLSIQGPFSAALN